jgi:hypothetical protein
MNTLATFAHTVAILILFPAGSTTGTKGQSLNAGEGRPTNCAHSITVLDVLAQNTPKDELIIVVARLGDGEIRRELNHRRLHNVRHYLTKFLTHESVRRSPETVLVAEGERVKGYGRVEFYVGGKLFDRLYIMTGGDLVVSCYDSDPVGSCTGEGDREFYPCRDRRPAPMNRRRRVRS